ncbi:MAG: glucose-6-phosphate isomerase [Methylobacteriaceae bacterium]|nr:glucose-6-phosphate isomerase [Methylobacteriaceae bacterium]
MTLAFREALAALEAHRHEIAHRSMRDLFADDPQRFPRLTARLDDLLFDYSKQPVTDVTMAHLIALARAARLEDKRDRFLAGETVNTTEGRPAMHMALRDLSRRPIMIGGADMRAAIEAERARCAGFADELRSGRARGASGKPIRAVVNIGIGGSDLGPAMAVRALSPFATSGLVSRFVSNVDGADLADALNGLDPGETLFIVSSKTFTTLETMTNARSARAWIVAALGEAAAPAHFAAVSTNLPASAAFGVRPDRVFGFWDWVGGRYSMWSSIGLPLMIAIGPAAFEAFLAGGHEVDRHFATAPAIDNIPMLMALIGVWHRNVWGRATQAVIPYDQRLARFPAYLQQLDMESNGKSVTHAGAAATIATAPIVWGEPGTNGQHAFFQLLHQGTEIVPVDFLVAAEPIAADKAHHDLLVANCLAQGEALMRGRTRDEAAEGLSAQGLPEAEVERLAPHKTFAGNRPSSTLFYRRLDPRMLGRLVALYEHKVFAQAAIWDINAFDQWGVELGKELATRLAPIVADPAAKTDALDASTAGLIAWRRRLVGGA